MLPGLSEPEQIAFLDRAEGEYLHTALSLGLLRHDDAQARNLSAGWLLNGKGRANEVFARRALWARAAQSKKSSEGRAAADAARWTNLEVSRR